MGVAEIRRLKNVVVDLILDKTILQDMLKGKS